MLERARGCLEHNGRRLLCPRAGTGKQQRLGFAFWSHGAEDIELPGWWTELLSRTTQKEEESVKTDVEIAQRHLKAAIVGGPFLDFLYPHRLLNVAPRSAAYGSTPWRPSRNVIYRTPGSSRHIQRSTQNGAGGAEDHSTNAQTEEWLRALQQEPERDLPAWEEDIKDLLLENSANGSGKQTPSSSTELNLAPTSSTLEVELNGSSEERQERLYSALLTYQTALVKYERMVRESPDIEKDEQFAIKYQAILEAATDTYSAGREVIKLSQSLVMESLYFIREPRNWSEKDFQVALRVHLWQSRFRDTRFLEVFDNLLHDGRIAPYIGSIVKSLVTTPPMLTTVQYRARTAHLLYAKYTTWRQMATEEAAAATRQFWEYATQGYGRLEITNLLAFNRLFLKHGQGKWFRTEVEKQPTLKLNFTELAKAIISHADFPRLGVTVVLDFYNILLQSIKRNSFPYEAMVDLLKTMLFTHPSYGIRSTHLGVYASKVMDEMEVHGGYSGQSNHREPDLARKLFFQLTRDGLPNEAQKVFSNMQIRRMDRVQDYERLIPLVSKKGDVAELKRLEIARETCLARLERFNPGLANRAKPSQLDTYKDNLNLHRRRGEVGHMLSIFKRLLMDESVRPDNHIYNLMISGYARVNDLEMADQFFQSMLAVGLKQDVHSYVPMLQCLARRGDIDGIRLMTAEMEAAGIEINDWVINAHVYALIQGGRLAHAEELVWRSLTFKLEDRTKMWNYVLLAWAQRGHRRKVNRLMDQMKRNNIRFDAFTFACRMQMWLVRGSPRRAWAIVKTTMPRLGIRPYPFHFAMLIQSYARSKSRDTSLPKVYREMMKLGIQPDWNVKVALSEAFVNTKAIRTPDQALGHLRDMIGNPPMNDMGPGPYIMSRNIDDQFEVFTTGLFDFVFRLTKKRGFRNRFEEIWDMYMLYASQSKSSKPFTPPTRILLRIMNMFRRANKFEQVSLLWQDILKKAEELGRIKNKSILATRRSMLVGPTHSYLLSLHQAKAPISVAKETVADILNRGFLLDNRCWNLYLRMLCVSSPENHFLAFEIAEEQLFHGKTTYPILRESVKSGTIRGLLLRDLLDKRNTFARSTRTSGVQHTPLRMETSIGQGVTDEYLSRFKGQTLEFRQMNLDMAARDVPQRGRDEGVQPAIDLTQFGDGISNGIIGKLPTDISPATAYIPEGTHLRRPEYSTIVYIAGAYMFWRKRLSFDPTGADVIREIHAKAPRTVAMILGLPRIDDELQTTILRS